MSLLADVEGNGARHARLLITCDGCSSQRPYRNILTQNIQTPQAMFAPRLQRIRTEFRASFEFSGGMST